MLHILPKPLPTIIPNGLGIMLTTDGNILLHSKRYRRCWQMHEENTVPTQF